MSWQFYSAWAFVVVLAIVLPVAIPYAVWPPAYYDDAKDSGDCASIAKDYAAQATEGLAYLWPASVDVARCEGTLGDPQMQFRATVEARGPYGITWASAEITRSHIGRFEENGGAVVGFAAVMAGVLLVSMPFGMVLLRRSLQERLVPA